MDEIGEPTVVKFLRECKPMILIDMIFQDWISGTVDIEKAIEEMTKVIEQDAH